MKILKVGNVFISSQGVTFDEYAMWLTLSDSRILEALLG